jgi:Putative phage tail protein
VGKVLKSLAIAAVIVGVAAVAGAFTPVITATYGTTAVAGVTIGTTTIAVGGMSAIGSAILAMAASTVLSGISAQLFGPKMPKAQASRLNPSLDPQAHRKFVFGETAMNTDIRYFEPSGTDQEYFDFIIATSAHEVESIDSIWFDDREAWRNGYGVITPYVGYLTVTPITAGTAANYVTINTGTPWGSTCRLTGCSYVHIRIKRTGTTSKVESPLVNGLPSRVTIKGKGAKLYDPRRDSTVAGGSGSERATDQTTWGSGASTNRDNPALQLLWFLLGWKIGVNNKLSVGCGVPPSRIDLASFITAANICDEPIALAAGGTQPRYRTAGVGSDADSRMEIIQILLTAMNATLRDSNGKLSITVMKNDLATPVLEFGDDDVLGEFSWNQTRGLDEMMNAVHGKYTDPSDASLFQAVEYPVVSITSIDGIERMQTLDLPWVQEGRRAQRIAKQALQRAQYKGIFTATFSMKALGCEVGDIVYISFSPLGWADKPFRVLTQGINNTGQVPMTLIEENAAIYAWDASEQAVVTPTAPTVYDPLNSPYILAISDAEAAADGKIVSFYQASAPTAQGVGDIWFDTDDGNKMYRWNGSSWVAAQDTAISTAIFAAADAQATADGKVNTYFQASAPTPEAVGDLWFETDANNALWRWNGSTWVLATDSRVTAAINSDGTIATSKVATSAVQANAITGTGWAYSTSTVSQTVQNSPILIQQVTITTNGGPILITANFDLSIYYDNVTAAPYPLVAQAVISRNGSPIRVYSSIGTYGSGMIQQFIPVSLGYVDTPAAGTYTYAIYATIPLGSATQAIQANNNRAISVTELKR